VSVALVSQHARRMRRFVLLSVARQVLPYFSTLSDKQRDFWKNVVEHTICIWFSLQQVSGTKL
jgi:hypothetical protein